MAAMLGWAITSGCEGGSGVAPSEAAASSPEREDVLAPPIGAFEALPDLTALPWPERITAEQAFAASDPRFLPRLDEAGAVLEGEGAIVATFSQRGARIVAGAHALGLRVAALGRTGGMIAPAGASPEISGPEVRIALAPGVVEWWRSLPSGLEHGVTLAERPAGEGELRIEIATSEDLAPHAVSSDVVELRTTTGATALSYAHLSVLDADGALVPAELSVDGTRIVIRVADDAARYPLVVDPLVFTEETTITAMPRALNQYLGDVLAVTPDGSRAIVTADDRARIFVRGGTTWTQEAVLALNTRFGASIASDGSRAVTTFVNGPTIEVVCLVRSGTTWTEEARIPSPGNYYFGYDVAMSGDGNRVAVGAASDAVASVRVYVRSGARWTLEAPLEPGGGATALALSRDGARLVVGAEGFAGQGRARVYTRSGSTWTLETTLTEASPAAGNNFGSAVALSADQSRVVVGAPGGGTASVFRVSDGGLEATLTAPSAGSADRFGAAVAISGDGRRVVVGAPLDDQPGTDSGSVRVFDRTGTTWSYEADLISADRAPDDNAGTAVGISDDAHRVFAGVRRDNTTTARTGSVRVFMVHDALGSACGADDDCLSGFCTDGVCCNARCSGDCEACSMALSGGPDGTCTAAPTTTVCRASMGACDPAENCRAGGGSCPADRRLASGTECRASAGGCDPNEVCDGTSAMCPADARQPSGFECRAATNLCDRPELCDGTSATCPAAGSSGVRASGEVCRPTAGLCDLPEVCDGASVICPGNVLLGSGTVCGSMPGTCASAGTCNGTSPDCLGSGPLPADTVCLAASPANPCDVNDVCDGTSLECPARFAPATTVCNDLLTGLCDTEDLCAGTSADCIPTFLDGVECRPADGACDSPEFCSGSSPVCPADAVEAAGMTCRSSVDPSCDPTEVCDGLSSSCPADESTCLPDAGLASDAGRDASPGDGGGPPSPAAATCGCRAGGSTHGTAFAAWLVVAVLAVRRRR